MTEDEIIKEIKSDSALNRARRILRSCHGKIEQGCAQREPLTSIEIIDLEFEAVKNIFKIATEIRNEN